MARLEEEKKKKKKGCERKKISGRNTEKRMPPLPPLHPPPPRPPRSRTKSEWIALLLRGGEERLQDLRENRSSSFKTLLRVGWKEGEKFVIPFFDLPCNRCSSFRYTYSRNESSSLELIEIFPPLPVIRNIFPSFPQSRRFYYYRSLEITAFETHLHVPSSSLPVRRTRAYLIMTAIEISVRTGDTIINYAAIIVRHFVV